VVCLSNEGYPASLEVRKIYATVPDPTAQRLGMLRVVDESGEDYLYPSGQFGEIALPAKIAKAFTSRGMRPTSRSRA
jgi:hypothetical protein